jgi:diguanylate cyclase (GGDEF)-like protein/PAS domain S-box-containing protein
MLTNFSMDTAAAAYFVSMAVVVVALLYLRSLPAAPAGIVWWAAAFGVSGVRHLLLFVAANGGKVGILSVDTLQAASAVLLLAGAFAFLGRSKHLAALVWAWILASGWAAFATLSELGFLWKAVPLSMFIGLAAVYAGIAFLRNHRTARAPGHGFVGVVFILWGIHRMDFPFTHQLAWFVPWGALVGQGLATAIGIGLIITVLQTLQRRAQESETEVRQSHQRLESIIGASPNPIMISRAADHRVLFSNSRAADRLATTVDGMHGRLATEYFREPSVYYRLIQQLDKQGSVDGQEVMLKSTQDEAFWVLLSLRPITFGTESAILTTFTDITDRKRLEMELNRLATTDSLTGIYNRRRYLELSDAELKRAIRYERPLAIMMMDVDHFKNINDTYGHSIGDQLLVRLTHDCQRLLRKQDVFGRIGGEEFAITLPETGLTEAIEAAERLRETIEEAEIESPRGAVRVTTSIGVTVCAPDDTIDSALRRADQALYSAKRAGRNQVVSLPPT